MMANTLGEARSNPDASHSPCSILSDSSPRSSSVAGYPEQESLIPASDSPSIRLTRKRAAPFALDIVDQPRIEDIAPQSAGHSGPPSLPTEQVCLCQPEPRIPRPRNAFILYRQHYQSQVVAQNPDLANPEISKIIGEQWREQTPEVKSDWKRLAEEEKQRHQRQYPGYRYQPRRAGKPNPPRPISTSTLNDTVRCPKCGGRYISTPATPLTPFTPQAATTSMPAKRIPPPVVTSRTDDIDRSRLEAHDLRMDIPRLVPPYPPQSRPQYRQPLQMHQQRQEDMELMSQSQGQKRRRYNDEPMQGYVTSPASYGPAPNFRVPPPSAGGYRQPPTPVTIGRPGTTGPLPPCSAGLQFPPQRQQLPNRSSTLFDETLRLPPLNIPIPNAQSTSDRRPNQRDVQACSVEAMVMTIPYLTKVSALKRITGPLASPGLLSPAQETRGAVVAVESAYPELLHEVGTLLHEILGKDTSCSVRVWSNSPPTKMRATPADEGADAQTGDSKTDTPITDSSDAAPYDPFREYLDVIKEWHHHSAEITKHITTNPTSTTPEPPITATTPSFKVVPIALIPGGYSLTRSDTYALRTPINDSYSPMDHWRWIASLWRGIIGPDLTIYVDHVSREELDRYKDVELRGECNAIVVRVLDGGQLEERTMRRLGFEVSEFVKLVGAAMQ